MKKSYYKATIHRIDTFSKKDVHDRILLSDVVIYKDIFGVYCYAGTQNVVNTKEDALSIIYDMHYSWATYFDEGSVIPITKQEAACRLLSHYWGENIGEVSQNDATFILQRVIKQ